MAAESVTGKRRMRIRISAIIANDYAARGVSELLLPLDPCKEEPNTGAKHYEISAPAVVAIHDDALERLSVRCGKEARGLKIAYAALCKQIAYRFGNPSWCSPGYLPATLDPAGSEDNRFRTAIQVGLLFARLRIPAAANR